MKTLRLLALCMDMVCLLLSMASCGEYHVIKTGIENDERYDSDLSVTALLLPEEMLTKYPYEDGNYLTSGFKIG